MPRSVPAALWEACVRHVYQPFVDLGIVLQVDIHDSRASDGGRNVNVHGLATLREIDGEGFAKRKNRQWNDAFRERGGRAVREQFAERLSEFCQSHGIDYQGDAKPNSERDRPASEPELPRWNFEAWKREDDMTEALVALQQHRARRRQWEAAEAEAIEAALDLTRIEIRIRERRRGASLLRPDRRAAAIRAWHGAQDWIDADTVAAIRSTRFDEARACLWIDLIDGSTLVDHGHSIALHGRLTWQAALETTAAAERHGWTEVAVSGDQAYKDAVSVAAMLRGITVTNHELSPSAKLELERLQARHVAGLDDRRDKDAAKRSAERHEDGFEKMSSRDLHLRLTKRAFVDDPPPLDDPAAENRAPVLKPRFANHRAKRPSPDRLRTRE